MSERLDFKGDYMGFTYNGIHSSELGIVRVSDGSRFNENLLPTMQDKTVQVPGGDGTYYFGSYYTQKQFSISFAFDDLTEQQIARLKSHFGDKGIHDLIFDEVPYKIYSAKVTGTATLKYIPFAEGTTNRLYKGEGTIQFTCYTPFARSAFKWMKFPQYDNNRPDKRYVNYREWQAASGILDSPYFGEERFDTVIKEELVEGYYKGNKFPLYNPGDIESNFTFKIQNTSNLEQKFSSITMRIGNSSLTWKPFVLKSPDVYVLFNSKTQLIEGYNSSDQKTGNIYNQYIIDGAFFKIPRTTETDVAKIPYLEFTSVPLEADSSERILFTAGNEPLSYNYYYF